MSTYAVSFTITSDQTYSERYASFMDEVRKCQRVWSETTSFCLVETYETLADFERRLYLSAFAPSKDKMLVINVSNDPAIAGGAIDYPATLRALLSAVEIK